MTSVPTTSTGTATERPEVLFLDVNQTLSDTSVMAEHFADAGLPGSLATTWFASVLRDGFARTAAGSPAAFADVARGVLRVMVDAHVQDGGDLTGAREDAVDRVMQGFLSLPVHDDVPPGLRALADADVRVVTLTNGATSVSEGLLERAGLLDVVERLLSVEDAPAWKPAAAAYEHGLQVCGVEAGRAMLAAVHAWDVDGAHRAGLRTAWVNRDDSTYPDHFAAPDVVVRSFVELGELLTA